MSVLTTSPPTLTWRIAGCILYVLRDITTPHVRRYAVLKDGLAHINMRVTAPLGELDVITYECQLSFFLQTYPMRMRMKQTYHDTPVGMFHMIFRE